MRRQVGAAPARQSSIYLSICSQSVPPCSHTLLHQHASLCSGTLARTLNDTDLVLCFVFVPCAFCACLFCSCVPVYGHSEPDSNAFSHQIKHQDKITSELRWFVSRITLYCVHSTRLAKLTIPPLQAMACLCPRIMAGVSRLSFVCRFGR